MNNNSTTLKQVAINMMEKDLEGLNKALKTISTAIDVPNTQISEILFQEHFLDVFKRAFGEDELTDEDTLVLGKWIELAGLYGEIDLLNNNNEVILTVPPLYSRNTNDDLPDIPWSQVMDTYAAKTSFTAHQGLGYLTKMLAPLNGKITIDKSIIDKWNNVFKRYQTNQNPDRGVTTSRPMASKPISDIEGIVYD